MSKTALRQTLRAARKSFVAKRGANCFSPPPCIDTWLSQPLCIALYASNGWEPDVLAWPLPHQGPARFALPYIPARDAAMEFRHWHTGAALATSVFGFAQPNESAPSVVPDIILTPLVGFDHLGNRLGQGAGHYDRAFANLPDALRIGIAWSAQQVPLVPADPWDVPLDMIITECETLTFPHSRTG